MNLLKPYQLEIVSPFILFQHVPHHQSSSELCLLVCNLDSFKKIMDFSFNMHTRFQIKNSYSFIISISIWICWNPTNLKLVHHLFYFGMFHDTKVKMNCLLVCTSGSINFYMVYSSNMHYGYWHSSQKKMLICMYKS